MVAPPLEIAPEAIADAHLAPRAARARPPHGASAPVHLQARERRQHRLHVRPPARYHLAAENEVTKELRQLLSPHAQLLPSRRTPRHPRVNHGAQLGLPTLRQRDAARALDVAQQHAQELDHRAWTTLLVRRPLDAKLGQECLEHLAAKPRRGLVVADDKPIIDKHNAVDAHARHTPPKLRRQ